jgi:glucose-1-phosphate thymidylyltransferase
MKIIIPMAGMGKRLRPHTLLVPKPLIPIAGKPMVQRIVEDITHLCTSKVEEIHFVVGRFGKEVEDNLVAIAEKVGAKGIIAYQDQPLGTAHAILCAKAALDGNVLIAFADTLFVSDDKFDESADGVIFVNKVPNWQQFGVVKLNDKNIITDFVEKPAEYVSDLAIIGIYYFRDGKNLHKELQYLIDHDIQEKGEYQLTNAMENMKNKGLQFVPGAVKEWLDCGNKDATVYTNQRILDVKHKEQLVSSSMKSENTVIKEPCFIGENVRISNSSIGPYVSIGANTVIEDANIENSIIGANTHVHSANFKNSMVGSHVRYMGSKEKSVQLSLGDYSTQD